MEMIDKNTQPSSVLNTIKVKENTANTLENNKNLIVLSNAEQQESQTVSDVKIKMINERPSIRMLEEEEQQRLEQIYIAKKQQLYELDPPKADTARDKTDISNNP